MKGDKMKYLLVILLCSGCVMQLRANDHRKQLAKLMIKAGVVQVKQVQKSDSKTVVYQAQSITTKKTYGSMKKPMKTITIDVYQEVDVELEQKQKQIAMLIAKLRQLQESKVKVNPKLKVVVRE